MLGSIGNSLFKSANTLNSMAALDDQTSMFSVAARDAAGSSGRVVMEYKRDPHGGRERLLEEALTLAIWGFGVRAIKQIYDAGMTGPLKGLGVKLPDLDTGILPKGDKASKQGPQTLTRETLQRFKEEYGHVDQYKVLDNILQGGAKKYQVSSVAKFCAASMVPAAAIAFAVPTFNQWLTRNIMSKEAKAKQAAAKSANPNPNTAGSGFPAPHLPGLPAFNAKPWVHQQGKNNGQMPAGFGTFPAQGAVANPFMTAPAGPQGQVLAAHQPGQPVRFGGIGSMVANGASNILQNEQYNTLIIDGVISGGRTYKARNRVERAEIIFRELSLIAFLYFVQGHIQTGVNKVLGKAVGVPTELGFTDMQFVKKYLADSEKDPHKNPAFMAKFEKDAGKIFKAINEELDKQYGDKKVMAGSVEHRADALVKVIHNYFLKDRKNGLENLVFETAIHSGLIPTFKDAQPGNPKLSEQLKDIVRELNPAAERNLSDNKYLDLSKKIDAKGVLKLQDGLEKFVNSINEKAGEAGHNVANAAEKQLPHVLNKVMALRAGSLVASNIACFAALSVAFPEIQHWITYKMTGKNYFPGVQNGNDDPAAQKKLKPMQPQPQAVAVH